jgi:RNA polymerase sigma-70 factor (ECF subfamily)
VAEDNVLISRAQSGDEAAFAELMQAHYAYVYGVVIKIVNNPHDAEEVVQETFFSAYRGLPQLEDRRKFKGWLAKIARNRAHNWRREQKVDTVSIDEVSEHTLQNPDSPEEQLIRREQRELIRRAMGTLSEKDREIAHAYYLDGASYDELIQTHGLSYKAISVRLSRVKQKLAKRLSHLLTAIFLPPATTLKQIYSGGLFAMKIGTAPKITIGAIGIIALIFIGFIGSRQLLSSKDNVSQSVEAVGQTSDMTAEQVAQTDASRQKAATTPSPEAERPITEQERQQIKNFFGQFEESDAQPETVTPQAPTESESEDESISTDTAVELPTTTEQTAEDVMNTFVEAFRNFDIEALLLLTTGTIREEVETFEEGMEQLLEDVPDEMEQQVLDTIFETFRQMKVTSTEYVGDEFHFRVSTTPTKIQSPEIRTPTGSSRFTLSSGSEVHFKMRKEDGVWRIYEAGPGN